MKSNARAAHHIFPASASIAIRTLLCRLHNYQAGKKCACNTATSIRVKFASYQLPHRLIEATGVIAYRAAIAVRTTSLSLTVEPIAYDRVQFYLVL